MITSPALKYIKADRAGIWCQAGEDLHALHAWVARTSYPLPLEVFRASLEAEPGHSPAMTAR